MNVFSSLAAPDLPALTVTGIVKLGLLLLWIAAAIYVHRRGQVRHGFTRQATDHSTFLAPINSVMYLASRVPSVPFQDVAAFPALAPLQQHWTTIRDEALAAWSDGRIKAADGYTDVGFNSFFRSGWTRFYLKWYGAPPASAREHCPRTLAMLEAIPEVTAAMFAVLPPGAVLPRHRDPYAGSLRYHLGLVTANSPECYIEVDGIREYWRDGESMIFDETFIHTARNDTDVTRIILFCDIERPLGNPLARGVNRLFRRTVMRAAAAENVPGEHVGVLNRVFATVYQVRLVGKKLKAKSRFWYYTTKYLLFGAVIWAVFL